MNYLGIGGYYHAVREVSEVVDEVAKMRFEESHRIDCRIGVGSLIVVNC